jgi:crotonobetainyl-CoA:carnitine CoA-transferase CaiB-like acyl-CoA transferase
MRQYAALFAEVNAGKRSVVLDLKDPADRARGLALATGADVVVEGFRPGVLGRLGLDEGAVRAVNPDVIYCSISGYGQTGPRALLPGHDVNYQAWAGSLAPEGGPATMPPLPVADLASGLTAAFGICAALLGRGGGPGATLDVSMTDVMATWTGRASAADPGSGAVPGYGIFTAADGGQVALGVVSEPHFWAALCRSLGLESHAGLPFDERQRRGAELSGAVAAAVGRRPRDDVVADLLAAGVPVAPVLDRVAMVAAAPFPAFPLGGLEVAVGVVPELDAHAGQGFGPGTP